MNRNAYRSRKVWITSASVVLVLGFVVWGAAVRSPRAAGKSTLPAELSVDALKAKAAEPGRLAGAMRDALRRDDLTEEQRREAAANMRKVWEDRMTQRVDAYFAAAPEDQQAVLDEQIDEFQKQMQAFEERRKEADKNKKPGENEPDSRRRFGPQSQQERKAHSESRNPDQTARRMAYFAAVNQRMAERGISPPAGRGPGRGGWGGRGP